MSDVAEKLMTSFQSPYYKRYSTDWIKYRDILRSGRSFIIKYLKKYSLRETTDEFNTRKEITYCPAIARASLVNFKNAIFQRMADITRNGGDVTYQEAIEGNDLYGVDNDGRSMDQFIGQKVILELLAMQQVGVFVDRQEIESGASRQDMLFSRPYLYTYRAEDIINIERTGNTLSKILLRRNEHVYDGDLGLYIGDETEYIYMEKTDSGIIYRTYGDVLSDVKIKDTILDLPEIPFVLFEIEQSLLKDISDYQIALLNIESGDINFCFKANFPFYTEQQELQSGNMGKMNVGFDSDGNETDLPDDTSADVKTGVSAGRIYAKGMERPGFINPSAEPLTASMAKQAQMKEAVEYLIGLNLSSLASSSAENKQSDSAHKEEGLSAIGLELERGERRIAEIWSMYIGDVEVAQVDYPNNYSLRTDDDRRKEASEIIVEAKKIPSVTYQKEAAKRASRLIMTQGISKSDWDEIDKQIDESVLVFVDPEDVRKDREAGLVSIETASELIRKYPKGEAAKAKKDKEDFIKQTMLAQTKDTNNAEARLGGGEGARDEKTISQDSDLSDTGKKVRGEEK